MSFASPLGTLRGHDGIRDAIQEVRHAVTGFTETIQDMIVEGDKVVTRYLVTGVNRQPFRDVSPTGQPIHVEEISIYRVRDGLVVEQWCGRVTDS
jgi:predicted ester cyclase